MRQRAADTGGGSGSECVIWHTPGGTVPRDLARSLQRRGVLVTACSDPYHAVAYTCSKASGTGANRGNGVILVLVEPRTLDRAARVVSALSRYAPGAAVWQYETDDAQRLRSVEPGDPERWAGPENEVHGGQASAAHTDGNRPRRGGSAAESVQPRLRLITDEEGPVPRETGDDERTPTQADENESDAGGGRAILTEEELAMLLSDETGGGAGDNAGGETRGERP